MTFIDIDEAFKQLEETKYADDGIDKFLLKNRTVFLTEEISEDSMNRIIKRLLFLDAVAKEDITISLCTDGGDVYEFLRLYDVVRSLKSKVSVYASGRVFSAGMLILSCCSTKKRIATKHTTFMGHEVSSGMWGKLSDMKNNVNETERVEKLIKKLLIKHTKLKTKQLQEMESKDYYFDATEALKLGIIDEIQ